jgi:hypothetical protein
MQNQPDPVPEIDAEIIGILEALKKGGWDYSIKGNEIRIYRPEWLKDVTWGTPRPAGPTKEEFE